MIFGDKMLPGVLMLWRHLLLEEHRAKRLFETRSYSFGASWSAEVVFSREQIRSLTTEAPALFRALPDALQPGFFLASLGPFRGPCVAVIKRMGEVAGVVYGWELVFNAGPSGYLFVDETLDMAIACAKEDRDWVLKMALSAWLSSKRIGAIEFKLALESRDVNTVREAVSEHAVNRFEELTELHPILFLPSSYQDFEKVLGPNTRKHIRQYRGYSQANNQTYVPNMEVCEFRTAVAMLSDKTKFVAPEEDVERVLNMVCQMSPQKRMLTGLRAENGKWVAAALGWKELGRGVLVKQFNYDTKPLGTDGPTLHQKSNSVCTLLRSYLIEQLIQEGVKELWIDGTTGGFLQRYTTRLPVVTIYLYRPTVSWRIVRTVARFAARHAQKEVAEKLNWISPPAYLPQ